MRDAIIDYSQRFIKSLRKAPRKTQIAFRNRLELFLIDKYHPLLNNHSLLGRYKDYRSINISGDWRAIFRELENGQVVYFEVMGTHGKLYK